MLDGNFIVSNKDFYDSKKNTKKILSKSELPRKGERRLLNDLRAIIEQTRAFVAVTINENLVMLYWNIGARIRTEILEEKRADYGERIVSTLSRQLVVDYGKGFSRPNLFKMIRFAEAFPKNKIVSTLSRQLSWSHFVEIIALPDSLQREFYIEMCRIDRWSVRVLRERIQSMMYERTAISRKPAVLIKRELKALREKEKMTPDVVFRDPYVFNFLGLKDVFSERDLESAIISELQQFIIELGGDFAFVARQKCITIDHKEYFIDLLFYHRGMKRLVAIDLKLGKFSASDKGQMELYLNWLNKNERRTGEETPIGLILCAEKSTEHVELLRLDTTGIRVASYITKLLPKKLLAKKLHQAVRLAREQIARRTQLIETE